MNQNTMRNTDNHFILYSSKHQSCHTSCLPAMLCQSSASIWSHSSPTLVTLHHFRVSIMLHDTYLLLMLQHFSVSVTPHCSIVSIMLHEWYLPVIIMNDTCLSVMQQCSNVSITPHCSSVSVLWSADIHNQARRNETLLSTPYLWTSQHNYTYPSLNFSSTVCILRTTVTMCQPFLRNWQTAANQSQ